MASEVGRTTSSPAMSRSGEAPASSAVARSRYTPVANTSSSTTFTTEQVAYASLIFFVALCTFPPGAVCAAAVVVLIAGAALIGMGATASKVSSCFSKSKNAPSAKPAPISVPLSPEAIKEFNEIYAKKHPGSRLENLQVKASTGDQGGHGGNLKASATEISETGAKRQVHFFLKPIDMSKPAELNNYKYINNKEECKALRGHMTATYNDPIEIDGQPYLIMHDIGIGKKVVADIKLAGKVDGINPIASRSEIKGTDRKKSWLDYYQMWFTSKTADDYMVAKGPKFLRFFNYWRSRNNVEEIIEKARPEKLKKLREDLIEMAKAMNESNIGFIGASILLLQDGSGNLEAKLIDPAHMQINPNSDGDPDGIYRGRPEDYHKYQKRLESNLKAMIALIETVEDVIRAKESRAASA